MPEAIATSDDQGLIAAITSGSLSEKMKKALGTYFAVKTGITVGKRIHRSTRDHFVYTVSVPSGDEIYTILHEKILALIPKEKRRSIVVRALKGEVPIVDDDADLASPADSRSEKKLRPRIFYDSSKEQAIRIGGYRILVTVEKEEALFKSTTNDRNWPTREKIIFTAYGVAARDALMEFLSEIIASLNVENKPKFYLADTWGSWNRRDDLEPRPLETVVLPAGQKESIAEDLQKFLNMREAYERLGIPYHRGYLFHGPPGSGKTTLARALASHFSIDIYYLPISDLDKDTNLLQMVSRVPARSILLLEDIDIVHSSHSREDEYGGVTMSGLLNALDGVATPAGLIVIMTTNNRDVLDDAIIRPGRVDREEYLGHLEQDQLNELVTGYFGEPVDLPNLNGHKIAPAEIAEVLKRAMGEPEAQRQALKEFLSR